jgi:hypothetical protein
MEQIINELQVITTTYCVKLSTLSELDFSAKSSPNKWSKKEVMGHLIDSAHNNLRRFICGQYEIDPPHIIYEQDFWVSANNYQHIATADLITLWKLVNQQICSVLSSMPANAMNRQVDTGRKGPELHALAWLAEDYVKHLKHHLNQVISNSFPISYP